MHKQEHNESELGGVLAPVLIVFCAATILLLGIYSFLLAAGLP
jgi:hypothetical protein